MLSWVKCVAIWHRYAHNRLTGHWSREAAAALYRQLPNVLIFTFAATSALTLYFYQASSPLQIGLWWAAMQLVILFRLSNLLRWRRLSLNPGYGPHGFILLFVVTSLITGLLWSFFTLMYFESASRPQRVVIALVMSTIASGSISVLALFPWVNRLFIALLVGPLVYMFGTTGDMDDLVIAALGIVLFLGLTGFSRVAREGVLLNIQAASDRERKIASAQAQRDELLRAKDALETRLAEQIETLEFEILLKERYAQELARVAAIDLVTGLLNRNSFEPHVRERIETNAAWREPLGLFAIEILRYDVLELQGFTITNQTLLALADRLKNCITGDAVLARWGDAEFMLALPLADRDLVQDAARLREVLRQPIVLTGARVSVDIIIGIACLPAGSLAIDNLLYQGAVAKLALRQLGQGGVKAFDGELDVAVKARQRLRRAMPAALDDDEFHLVFQPIEPSMPGLARKMEALLRWSSSSLGELSPAEFIPVAEETGLILRLGNWVLNEACRHASRWPQTTRVSVNVSVHQILSGELQGDIRTALEAAQLAPERLEIEITESVFAQDMDLVFRVLSEVRAMGVSIAIDDFGTGYSSLSYLRRLPIDVIKIDRSFVLELDQSGRKLLLAIVSMARSLGFHIVVEGIETYQQQSLLLAMGVDYMQGYLISHPLAPADAERWLIVD